MGMLEVMLENVQPGEEDLILAKEVDFEFHKVWGLDPSLYEGL
jgi:hypothetical protein